MIFVTAAGCYADTSMNRLILIVALICTACGGGGDAPPGTQETITAGPCLSANPLRVQLFGDSTQAGWDGATRDYAPIPPATALQAELDARLGAGRAIVTSRAASGTTATELVAGLDGLNPPWPASVAADIVVVNHGINDATHHGDMAAYQQALRAIAATDARVIFETPNVVRFFDVGPWAEAMRGIAGETHTQVADTYAYTVDLEPLLGDWAHPTQALYLRIAGNVLAPAVIANICR